VYHNKRLKSITAQGHPNLMRRMKNRHFYFLIYLSKAVVMTGLIAYFANNCKSRR